MAFQWVNASSQASSSSAASLPSSRPSSPASTAGSFKYVPPALRQRRNNLRIEDQCAGFENDLAEKNRAAARHQGPKLPVFDLPFFLRPDQLAFLVERYPRTTFRCTSDNGHDHPIAHTETMIATKNAHRMVPAGGVILDLFGSPTAADQFNIRQQRNNVPKAMIAYCALMSEKDHIRALKWGDEFDANGDMRYYLGNGDVVGDLMPTRAGIWEGAVAGRDLTYFLKHTLYYLRDDQIVDLLRPAGSRMLAVIHRHATESGSLFGGECSYGKLNGMVEQVNKLTGEAYVHRDLSFLWASKSKVVRAAGGAYTWTFHMSSPDTWIVELVGCPPGMDERFGARSRTVGPAAAAAEMNEHDVVPTAFPHPGLAALPGASCFMVAGVPVLKFSGGLLPPIRLSCPPLYDFLRLTIVGKPRDADRINDLFSLARAHVAGGTSMPGKMNFVLPAEDVAGHVVLALLAGIDKEVDLLRSVQAYRVAIREHTALVDGAALVVPDSGARETAFGTGVAALRRVNTARKSGDALSGILALVEK